MEEVNHQNFGIKLFLEYVADPSAASFAEPEELQTALEKFPYCQLLHLFYSRSLAAKGSAENADHLATTALIIPDRTILYSVIRNPEKLNNTNSTLSVSIESQVSRESPESEAGQVAEEIIDEEISSEESLAKQTLKADTIEEENPKGETLAEEISTGDIQSEETLVEESDVEVNRNDAGQLIEEEEISEESQTEDTLDKPEEQAVPISQEPEIKAESDWSAKEEPQSTIKETAVSRSATNDSDLIENIFNQLIGAIPPPVTPVAVHAVTTPFTDEDFISEPEKMAPAVSTPPQEESPAVGKEERIETKEEVEFKSEETIDTKEEEEVEIKSEEIFIPVNELVIASEENKTKDLETDQKVSKYDDDKMPYSFLWWLNKTRNEHSDTYQPYVEFKLDTTQTIKRTSVDQLSSQIIENIFHLQSPLEEVENAPKTVPFQVRRKEDSILDKFIKEEPQIKPPNSQKLDTENKARKSAEDPNDLVSETLAQIYTDQMLFQKAIDTFKKLSLKFPEKSTYFADQIIELEKKVN